MLCALLYDIYVMFDLVDLFYIKWDVTCDILV